MTAGTIAMLVVAALAVLGFCGGVKAREDARREIKRLKEDLREALEELDRQVESRRTRRERDDKHKAEFRQIIATLRTTLQAIGVKDPTKLEVPTDQTFGYPNPMEATSTEVPCSKCGRGSWFSKDDLPPDDWVCFLCRPDEPTKGGE